MGRGIWVTKEKTFSTAYSLNGNPNKWFFTEPQPLKTWIPIIISQKPSNGKVSLQGDTLQHLLTITYFSMFLKSNSTV